jgi:hypothetical protein
MLTGEIRNQIDRIWDAFWSGGIANPVDVIEQITYLLFLKRLDEAQEFEERKVARLGTPVDRRIFPEGNDHIFPWLRTLGEARPTRTTCATPASPFPSRSSPRLSI